MLPLTTGETIVVMPNTITRTFAIPPAFLERFPEAAMWKITVEADCIRVTPHQAPPPADYEPPTPAEIAAVIAASRADRRNGHHPGGVT